MVNCNTYSGAEIGIFYADSYLTFQGLVQFKVVAGLVNVHGHTFQPSTHFHDACPLLAQLKMAAVSVDGAATVQQKDYAVAMNAVPVTFRQARQTEFLGKTVMDLNEEDSTKTSLHVVVELNQADCREINNYIQHSIMNVCAIMVFRELRSNVVEILFKYFPLNCNVEQTSTSAGSKVFIKGGTINNLLEIPLAVKRAVNSLVNQKDLTLMITGQANTGKSTLARYTVNSLLNQHSRVAFLECDVGQTEFTPPGVVSITFVSQPLIGPPCTHQQSPEKAYFVGDNSPIQQPDLYICSINSLMQYFVGQKEMMPLIVNTCGWLKDLGSCLFWDLLQLISPTHVIHLHGGQQEPGYQSYWFRQLVPIDTANSHCSLGWLLAPSNSCDQPHPPNSDSNQPYPLIGETSKHRDNCAEESVEIQSSEMSEHLTDSETVLSAIPNVSQVPIAKLRKGLTTRRSKLNRRLMIRKRRRAYKVALSKGKAFGEQYLHRAKLKADLSYVLSRARKKALRRTSKATQDTGWRCHGVYQLFSHHINPYSTQTSSKALREVAMAVYFAQLNDETSRIMPWPELILAAIPYEIKWHQLAVHCLTVEVSLY